MGRLLANPNTRMQSMLSGAAEARNAAMSRFVRIRDSHFGIGPRPSREVSGIERLRRLDGVGAFGEGLMEGLTPILRTEVMLNEWERANAAARAYDTQVRRAAANEYWAQTRENALERYRQFLEENNCGDNQACRMRAARQAYGTRLPASGTWSGTPGDSVWTPDAGTPASDAIAETNAARAANGQSPVSGVRYRNGFPDFRPFSSGGAAIPDMQGNLRTGPGGDVFQARNAMGDRWSPDMEVGRTWHHNQNTVNMQLVDSRIHNATIFDTPTGNWLRTGGALHTGGASIVGDPLF